MGYPAASAVMVTAWPGANPSTVVPKTSCDFKVSLICIRGSAEESVESRSSTRPSSALEETIDGKLTVIWARRGAMMARNPARRNKKLRRIPPSVYDLIHQKLRVLKGTGLRVCVRVGERTAGPSTTLLRSSGRGYNSDMALSLSERFLTPRHRN